MFKTIESDISSQDGNQKLFPWGPKKEMHQGEKTEDSISEREKKKLQKSTERMLRQLKSREKQEAKTPKRRE